MVTNIHMSLNKNLPHSPTLWEKDSKKYSLNSKYTVAYSQQIIWYLSSVCCSISCMLPTRVNLTLKKLNIKQCTEVGINKYSKSRGYKHSGYRMLKDWVMVVLITMYYSLIPWTDLEMWLAQEVVPVCQKLGGLAQLSCQRVDEVRHKACVVVVSL